jgi:hypothetical protein
MKNICTILLMLTLASCDTKIQVGEDKPDVIVNPPPVEAPEPTPKPTSCLKHVSWDAPTETELGTPKDPTVFIDYYVIEHRGDVGEPKTLRLNQSSFKAGERIGTDFNMPLKSTLCMRAKSVTHEPRESDWSEMSCVKCDESGSLTNIDMNQGEL